MHPLVLASVTDSIFEFTKSVINDLGLGGLLLLIAMDATGIPVAASACMIFAGVNVSEGHHTLVEIGVAGAVGDVLGATLAYWIGRLGRYELVERHGRKMHLTPDKVRRSERWFERYGTPVVAIGRFVPVVRTYVSFPAGVSRMPFGRFALATAIGGTAQAFAWGALGDQLGSSYDSVRHSLGYVDYAVVALAIAALAYWALVLRRRRTAPTAADAG